MSVAEIKAMTNAERLEMMEVLWDTITHSADEPKSPSWHKDVLAGRRKRIESGEAQFFTIEEARKMLSND